MAIKAGTKDDFSGSMAADMEAAFEAAWVEYKSVALPAGGEDDRRLLFIAIAQGVVKHLKENVDAFDIEVETTQVTAATDEPLITSAGDSVTVTQKSGSDNMVRSRGSGTVDDLLTAGTLY